MSVVVSESLLSGILRRQCTVARICSGVRSPSKGEGAIESRATIDANRISGDLDAATAPAVVLVGEVTPRPRLARMARVETDLIRLHTLVGLHHANLLTRWRKSVGNDTRGKWKLRDKEVTDVGNGKSERCDQDGFQKLHFRVRLATVFSWNDKSIRLYPCRLICDTFVRFATIFFIYAEAQSALR